MVCVCMFWAVGLCARAHSLLAAQRNRRQQPLPTPAEMPTTDWLVWMECGNRCVHLEGMKDPHTHNVCILEDHQMLSEDKNSLSIFI